MDETEMDDFLAQEFDEESESSEPVAVDQVSYPTLPKPSVSASNNDSTGIYPKLSVEELSLASPVEAPPPPPSGIEKEGVMPASPEENKGTKDLLACCWFDAMKQHGLEDKCAKEYSNLFSKLRINAASAHNVTEAYLVKVGVQDKEHRQALLELIAHLQAQLNNNAQNSIGEEEFTEDEEDVIEDDWLFSCWLEAMVEYGLSESDARKYAAGFSANQITEDNAAAVDDEQLLQHGVIDPQHRSIILGMIQDLIKNAPSKIESGQPQTDDGEPMTQAQIDKTLAEYEIMERKLADIFAGKTERQQKLKLEQQERRKERETKRTERRAKYLEKKYGRLAERLLHHN